MNEILLYNAITQDSAANFISNLGWMGENQVYSVRMYCPGGDVQAGWGMWAKINELKAKGCHSIAKVDGSALSMGGFLLCSFDERLALSVSQLMIHRAVMPEYDENGEKIIYSASDKEFINRINADLKSRLLQIIDQEIFKSEMGYSIDDLFDEGKERINCFLTPQQALKIGLLTGIIPLDTANSKTFAKAAEASYKATAATAGNQTTKKMTKEELLEKEPDACKAIQKEAIKAYQAKMKAKAKAEDTDPDEDDDDDTDPEKDTDKKNDAKAMAKAVKSGVEMVLKSMGIEANAQTNPQTAIAAAQAAIKAEVDAKIQAEAKAEETKKALASVDEQINAIKSGKKE